MAELRFDVTGNTATAQRSLKDLSGAADAAARGARVLADSLDKQKRAAAASAAATIAAAKADKILADASDEAIAAVVEERIAHDKAKKSKEDDADATRTLGQATKDAARGVAGMVSPMGLLVGAAASLAPVAVTVGAGLAGLGLAAAGIVSPILKAAEKTGGLKANMDKLDPAQRKLAVSVLGLQKVYDAFQKSLEPVLFADFNAAIGAARPLLADLQPVAFAVGNALAFMIKQVSATFRSGQWQQFFQFMARTASSDVQQLTAIVVDLTKALPGLLEALQPVAQALLALGDYAAKAIPPLTALIRSAQADEGASRKAAKGLDAWTVAITNHLPGGKAINDQITKFQHAAQGTSGSLQQMTQVTGDLLHPIGSYTKGLQSATAATQAEKQAVTQLTAALAALSSGLLTGQADQVAWKQAQQAATQAIKQATGSLDSNRASSLAARAAIIQSTQAAIAYASQEEKLHNNIDVASQVIRAQIRYLQEHAGQSRVAKQEVDALRQALAQLKSKQITITERGIGHFSIFGRNTTSTPKLAQAPGGAAGLFINRGTTPTADDVLVRASKGELIVPAKMVSTGLVDHLRGSIPGFAAGGVAGMAALPGQTAAFGRSFQSKFTAAMENAMTVALRAAIARVSARSSGALGGDAAANQRLARAMFPWPAWMWPSYVDLEMREAGFNRFARNPSSGAYGIPQALPPTKMPFAAQAAGGSHAGAQLSWMYGYIRSVYGNPVNADHHELLYHWYDRGGYLPPGLSLAYNGTGRPEMVTPAGRGGGANRIVLQFQPGTEGQLTYALVNVLTQHVRDAGGGDVQVAFGTSY